MKFFILTALLIELAVAQNGRRDTRCPLHNGNMVINLPHPTECGSFLQCNSGNTFELRCPSNLHWSVDSNSCETPERARCALLNQPPNGPQRPQRPNFPRPDPWQEIEHPDYLNCPNEDTPGSIVFYPYHLNCANFYQCVNGRAVL